jgi:transposase
VVTAPAASIGETARHFGVSAGTVRRWVREGCPTIELGSAGRGRGSRLDLTAVTRWRGRAVESNTLEVVHSAIFDVAIRDGGGGRPIAHQLGIAPEKVATLFSHLLSRIERSLKPSTNERF